MNKFFGILVVLSMGNAYAQDTNGPPLMPAITGDVVEFSSVEQMPHPLPPSEVEKLKKGGTTKSVDGFSTVDKSPDMVKGFFQHMNKAKELVAKKELVANPPRLNSNNLGTPQEKDPEVHKNLSTLKVGFKAASFDRATLIAASPAGTKINDSWTGLERFFHVENAGVVRLTEYDLGTTNGKFYMLKDAIKTRVLGKPAISKVFTDNEGQMIEQIVWVNGTKFYMLTFGPDLVASNANTKLKANPHVSAASIANELR